MKHFQSPRLTHPTKQQGWLKPLLFCLWITSFIAGLFGGVSTVSADPYPPTYPGTAHFPVVNWPADGNWVAYQSGGNTINDPRVQDPSNGGTSPQNYTNISSCLPDVSAPSVYWYFDSVNDTFFYRFKVEQVPNTYATGPNVGGYSATDPWNSAQWTVFFDITGDGYRDFVVQLDGSSGSPSAPIDRLTSYWATSKSNTLDPADPTVHQLFHNPTAFSGAGGKLLNFHNTNTPDEVWSSGGSASTWDYGTTRVTYHAGSSCDEYIVDYQIPLGMLDASAEGGPTITENTPMAFSYATANSLNNPVQKDFAAYGSTYFVADPTKPIPFGDILTPDGGSLSADPLVAALSASGCGPTYLSATVNDALIISSGTTVSSVQTVVFNYYYDKNGNGLADDAGQTWHVGPSGTTSATSLGKWTATFDSTSLRKGQYLWDVTATDNDGNITTSSSDNPTPPGNLVATWSNLCGQAPVSMLKSVSPSQVVTGETVTFTITLAAPADAALTVNSIHDPLPAGFTYVNGSTGGSMGITANPTLTGTNPQTLDWNGLTAVIPMGTSQTLTFQATASSVVGNYSNQASAETSEGSATSNYATVAVGQPRLTIGKSASVTTAAEDGSITYTITYSNDSTVSVSDTEIVDILPEGLNFVSATDSGVYTAGTRELKWTIGTLEAGAGPYTVQFTATVANPYPGTAPVPNVNTATITATGTDPANASTSVNIEVPRPALYIQKDANLTQVAAGGNVIFTITYANTGNIAATGVTITDPIPTGFSYVSSNNGGTNIAGTVAWTIGSLAAGATGSVQVTLMAATPYTQANPQTNTATISATNVSTPVSDSFQVGVTQGACASPTTLYFKNSAASLTAPVGLPAVTAKYYANTITPTDVVTHTVSLSIPNTETEMAHFYLDPAASTAISFTGSITTTAYMDKTAGTPITVRAYLYSYNPTSGVVTQMGTTSATTGNGKEANTAFSFVVTPTAPLNQGDRLLWRFTAQSSNSSNTVGINFDMTNAPSGALYCPVALKLNLQKEVDHLVASPGNTLQYTLKFTNTGTVATSGSVITDTLPAGTTYSSATLNGGAATPVSQVGQQVVFNVNSSGQASGVVASGASGSLVITAAVNQPMAPGIAELQNTASLDSTQTTVITDTAKTAVLAPKVSITKSVNQTALSPGDTAVYTLHVLNSGTGPATNVTVVDTLPVTAYYTYQSGSTTVDSTPVADPVSGTAFNLNLGTLTAGQEKIVVYHMQVTASGAPDGITVLSNQASVTDTQTTGSRTSDVVKVAITTLPNLRLTKAVSPAGPFSGGDILTYTLTLANVGGGSAANVVVNDPIPSHTGFVSGSSTVACTDNDPFTSTDGLDSLSNTVQYTFNVLHPDASCTLTFQVKLDSPLPNGTTAIDNTATAQAENAATRTATANDSASAAPVLAVDISGPASASYPAATITADATSDTLSVSDTSQFSVGQYIKIGANIVQILEIDPAAGTLKVDSAISVTNGDAIIGSLAYTITYANNGDVVATNPLLEYMIPSSPDAVVYDPDGGTILADRIQWNLPDLYPGDSGYFVVIVFPTGTGLYDNDVSLDCTELTPVTDTTPTEVGTLLPTKEALTTTVYQTGNAVAQYRITLTNQTGGVANDIVITDTLPTGFSFKSTDDVSITGGSRGSTDEPVDGDTLPEWGTFTLNDGGEIVLTFSANISASVGQGKHVNGVTAVSSNRKVSAYDSLATVSNNVTVTSLDFGDLANTYNAYNLLVNDGARHTLSGLTLGTCAGADVDAHPDAAALGDTCDDGVVPTSGISWQAAGSGSVDVTVNGCSSNCYLNAWADWNNNGSFDGGEQLFTDRVVVNGKQTLTFAIPGSASFPNTWNLRFRLNPTFGSVLPNGLVTGGEVEDYQWGFSPTLLRLVTFRTQHSTLPLAGLGLVALSAGLIFWRKRSR